MIKRAILMTRNEQMLTDTMYIDSVFHIKRVLKRAII